MFEREMSIRTKHTTLLQTFCEVLITSKVIFSVLSMVQKILFRLSFKQEWLKIMYAGR